MKSMVGPILCAGVLLSASSAAWGQVLLRGQSEAVAGSVTAVGVEGVTITDAEGGQRVTIVAWDKIRAIKGEHASEAESFTSLSEKAWRGVSRVQRDDYAAAEPLLDEVASLLKGKTGPTAATVFEAIVKCRLQRGAVAGATAAWLSWVESGADAPDRSRWLGGSVRSGNGGDASARGAISDPTLGLVPSLAPIWLEGSIVLAASSELDGLAISGNERVADLAMLYRMAMRTEASGGTMDAVGLPPLRSTHAGVRLVRDIVVTRVGDADARKNARTALQERINTPEVEPWVEGWCRIALGRSLIREPDEGMKSQGVIHLLHVPARLSNAVPELAPLALAEAAVALDASGDVAGGASVKAEILALYPKHPCLEWAPLRQLKAMQSAGNSSIAGTGTGARP